MLGISCDHIPAHKAWAVAMGGIPYPELSDWHPKGQACQAYDLWNEARGLPRRAVVIIDKAGIIRFRQTYEPGTLPNPQEVLRVIEGL